MDRPSRLALVADGHADCGETLALALELSGWRVCTADNGQDALVWLRHWTPDGVVLDARLPSARGMDIARVMRANPRFDATRIVLTDTWLADGEIAQAKALGIDAVWLKPFETTALMRDLGRPRLVRPPSVPRRP